MVASSLKLEEVSLKVDVLTEDADDDSIELLDEVAVILEDNELRDEELISDELNELIELLTARLDELELLIVCGNLSPFDPPQPAKRPVVNNNNKTRVLINFMAITCFRFVGIFI